MSKAKVKAKGGGAADLEPFHLVPGDSSGLQIYSIRLTDDQFDAVIKAGGGRLCMETKKLQAGGVTWKFDTKPEDKKGSVSYFDCLKLTGGVYEAVGPIEGKISLKGSGTVVSEKRMEKIKKTSEGQAKQKRDRAAIHHDPLGNHPEKKRRKSINKSTAIGGEKDKSKKKDRPTQLKIDAMTDTEKKDLVLHSLALRDMGQDELKERLRGSEIARNILKEIADWNAQKSVWELKPQSYRLVDVKHKSYTNDEERAHVRGRKVAYQPVVISINCEADAKKQRERFEEEHVRYIQMDSELKGVQSEFEKLGQELEQAGRKSDGQGEGVRERIVQLFEEKKEQVIEKHHAFMRLHTVLKTIKEKLQQWSASKAS